jgi:hypothetical protein
MLVKIWIRAADTCVENVGKNYPQSVFCSYPQFIIKLFSLLKPGLVPADHD